MEQGTRDTLAVVMMFALVALLGGILGALISDDNWEQNAVKAGHAEYYLDKDHVRQWRWLPTESEIEQCETNER